MGLIPEVINDSIATIPCIGNIVFERICGCHYHYQTRGSRRPFHTYRRMGYRGGECCNTIFLGIRCLHNTAGNLVKVFFIHLNPPH